MAENVYEGMFIFDSATFGRNSDDVSGGVNQMIEAAGGEILASRLWMDGRRLAYPINGQRKGTYWLTYFRLKGGELAGVERQAQLNDAILRQLFIKIDPRIVDALVQHVCRVGGPRKFVFDLTDTEYMDSTILGVLATVARWASEHGLEPPILANPSEDVAMVLSSMGFEHYFTIGDFRQQPDPTHLHSAPPGSRENNPKAQVLLDAHRALMAMNAKNRDEFRDVTQLLAQDASLHKGTDNS